MSASPSKAEPHARSPLPPPAVVLALALALVLVLVLVLAAATPVAAAPPEPAAAPPEPPAAPAGQLTSPPTVLQAQAPVLESGAPPLTAPAEVVLLLTIDATGQPADIAVARGLDPYRDAAAVRALGAFQFAPAEIDGAPAGVRIEYRFAFAATEATAVVTEAAPPVEVGAPEPEPTGRLVGHVRQRGTRRPLAGARVRITALGIEALADAGGRFELDALPTGPVELLLDEPDHAALATTERIGARTETEVNYYLEALRVGTADLVAVGKRPHREVVRRTVDAQAIATAPGSQGDALKVIQNLPGVARIPFGGADFVLRGGGYSESFIDGQPVPNVFHFGGLRSIVGAGLLERVDVYPGNYSARYGNANGGIVDIGLRAPDHEGIHGFGQVDLFDTSLFLEGPLGEHTSLGLGARRSYIDAVLPAVLGDEELSNFGVAPFYYDYQAALDHTAGADALRVQVLGSYDRMVLLQEDPVTDDPAVRGAIDAYEQWTTAQVRHQHRFDADHDNDLRAAYLIGTADTRVGAALQLKFAYHTLTLRDDLRARLSPALTLRAGPDIRVTHVVYDVIAPRPPKEGQAEAPLSTLEQFSAKGAITFMQPALYAELDWQLGPLLLVPGVRLEHYGRPDAWRGQSLVQPRLSSRLAVTEATTLKAGVGHYSNGSEIDERAESFGNPALGPQQSVHSSVGVEQRLGPQLLLDATGFHKYLFERVVAVEDPQLRYDNGGSGRAYGLELLARFDSDRIHGQLAYTLMRSERRDGPGEDYRLFELDQTHNVNAIVQVWLGRSWELGARFRYVTGNPETPYAGGIYDSDADTYVPLPGAPLSARQAAFHQLDVRIDKHWVFDTWRLSTYLDVQNVYNRANPEATAYNFDYSQRGRVAGLPLIPSLGLKGAF